MGTHFYSRRPLRPFAFILLLCVWCVSAKSVSAQSPQPENKQADSIHGTVVNSVTHEPIGRALVFSSDNRFATMTDSEGRFQLSFGQAGTGEEKDDASASTDRLSRRETSVRVAVGARKPGFLTQESVTISVPPDASSKELTLSLTPEALIVGRVVLPTSEASDTIQLELYRRQVQEGRAHWVLMSSASTKSNGEFRFAELPVGSYKLLTREMMDRDPVTFDPRGQLYGYPPVYFPNATDFAGAQTIQLAAGQIFEGDISLVRRPYYPVKVAVANAPTGPGIAVVVSVQGPSRPRIFARLQQPGPDD